jgi:hypothetical protein
MGCAQRNHPYPPARTEAIACRRLAGECSGRVGPFRKLKLAIESVWTAPSPQILRTTKA